MVAPDRDKLDDPSWIDFLMDEVAVNLNVLRPFMEGRIRSQMNSQLTVIKDRGRTNRNAKLSEKIIQPSQLTR